VVSIEIPPFNLEATRLSSGSIHPPGREGYSKLARQLVQELAILEKLPTQNDIHGVKGN